MAGKHGVLFLATLLFAAVFGVSTAKTVTVGGRKGWTIPPSASFYPNWASQLKLQVGDSLVFTFPAGAHTVAQVSKSDYDACTTTNTIGAVMTTAPSTISLTSAGTHYFICTVPGHCGANQKVAVTVAAAATPAPKASIPAPKMAPIPAPKMAPTPSAVSPTPATSSAPAPAAVTPSSSTTPPMPTTSPTGSPSEANAPSAAGAAPPQQANSAASTGVTLLSFLSIFAAFLVC